MSYDFDVDYWTKNMKKLIRVMLAESTPNTLIKMELKEWKSHPISKQCQKFWLKEAFSLKKSL